jgi:two-component system response regulator AtoC
MISHQRGGAVKATQTPACHALVDCLEKLISQNGLVKLQGVLIVFLREAVTVGSGVSSWHAGASERLEGERLEGRGARGRAREGANLLKGIFFSGYAGREVWYREKPIRRWIEELGDKNRRAHALGVLIKAMGDRDLLKQEGRTIRVVHTYKDARYQLSHQLPDLLILDLVLPDANGVESLRALVGRGDIEVVTMNSDGSTEVALDSTQTEGVDCLPSSLDERWLEGEEGGMESSGKEEARLFLSRPGKLMRFGPMVGGSPAMQEVYDLITRVAVTEASVLVTGESGTGKELVAQAIHSHSKRSKKPYFAVNCGAISPNLIDSELFGHEQGSFTGAHHMHKGHFERAHSGTIFLDEITEMPLELQVKLLRVLENGTFMRVGGDQQVETEVRVITATNRKPSEAVAEGKLRDDLLYRLNVFPIHLPPLRERREDIELLADYFLAQLNQAESASKKFTRATMERLRAYHWPGNVRELKNVVQRAFILAEDKIAAEFLPKEVSGRESGSESSLHLKVGTPLAEAERRLILATFDHCDGNKMKTAEVLGISLRTLYNRLDTYWNSEARAEAR